MNSRVPNDYRNTMLGADNKVPVQKPEIVKIPFSYVYNDTKTASTATENNIKISAGHNFVVTAIMGKVSLAGYDPTILIRDSGTNEYWTEKAVYSTALFGTAQYPNYLPQERFLKAGCTVYFTLSNPAATSTVQIVLMGYEIPIYRN